MTVRIPVDGGVVVVVAPGTVVVVVVDVVVGGSVEAGLVGGDVDAGGSVEWPDEPHEDTSIAAQAKRAIVGVSRRCEPDTETRLVPVASERWYPKLRSSVLAAFTSQRWSWELGATIRAMTIHSVQLARRLSSPVGTITLTASGGALVGLALNGPARASGASTAQSASTASRQMSEIPTDGNLAISALGEVDDLRNHDSFLAAGLLDDVTCQLGRYFDGGLRSFEVNLDPPGTEFQRRVWRALCEIPYGETRSYSDIASAVGQPKAARAVGMANHRNPIALIIPCHRVVGAGGSLTGYAAGLKVKEVLLNLEQAVRREDSEAATPRHLCSAARLTP